MQVFYNKRHLQNCRCPQKLFIHEIKKTVPVITAEIMIAASVTESEISVIEIFARFKKIFFLENKTLLAVKFINFRCRRSTQELAFGACPDIIFGGCNMDFSRCNQCMKKMLFKRSFFILAPEILIIFAKPEFKILDTHVGSGTSRRAAYDFGLYFVGFEIDKTYFYLQEKAFEEYTSQMRMEGI